MAKEKTQSGTNDSGLFALLRAYKSFIALLVLLTIISNGLNLAVPQIISRAIDSYTAGGFNINNVILEFFLAALAIFIFTYLQGVVQTYAAERVAKDLRTRLTAKISVQDFAYVRRANPSKLLTNLTSDVDAVKTFVAQAVSSIISSVLFIVLKIHSLAKVPL